MLSTGISLPVQQATSPARSTAAYMVWPRIIATLGPLLRLSCAPSPLSAATARRPGSHGRVGVAAAECEQAVGGARDVEVEREVLADGSSRRYRCSGSRV